MGGEAHVLVTGGTRDLVDTARQRIHDLEERWSRFLPDNELSRLNRCPERHVTVSAETFTLVDHAVAAWHATRGRYDPTVLPALRAAGYDRDLCLVVADPTGGPARPGPELAAPGCELVDLDATRRTIRLPAGVEIDPGGIGKGLAADMVTTELLDAGATGAMVNLGGDLRARGAPPDGNPTWSVAIEDPWRSDRRLLTIGLRDGAIATSSCLRRRWPHAGRQHHHIIDPPTGRPTVNELVAVTAVAAEAWWAEAVTKSVLVAGLPAALADAPGALVATVDDDGNLDMSPDLVRIAA